MNKARIHYKCRTRNPWTVQDVVLLKTAGKRSKTSDIGVERWGFGDSEMRWIMAQITFHPTSFNRIVWVHHLHSLPPSTQKHLGAVSIQHLSGDRWRWPRVRTLMEDDWEKEEKWSSQLRFSEKVSVEEGEHLAGCVLQSIDYFINFFFRLKTTTTSQCKYCEV